MFTKSNLIPVGDFKGRKDQTHKPNLILPSRPPVMSWLNRSSLRQTAAAAAAATAAQQLTGQPNICQLVTTRATYINIM